MYKFYTLVRWFISWKLEIKRLKMAADFHREFQTDKEVRDKEVGKAMLGVEAAQEKLKIVGKLFKLYVKNFGHDGCRKGRKQKVSK